MLKPNDEIQHFIMQTLMQTPKSVTPIYGGGNNQAYRITLQNNDRFVLKSYHVHDLKRDRLRMHREYHSFSFLHECGEKKIPRALACDQQYLFAIYSWITGNTITNVSDMDIDLVIAFVDRLKQYSTLKSARKMLPASDNALDPKLIFLQIERRLNFLEKEANQNQALHIFLNEQYKPNYYAIKQKFYWDNQLLWAPLSSEKAILSPSDFGFHNMLKNNKGEIFFIDFEYFGWEDPAALLAHFLLHPGMSLSQHNKTLFYHSISALFCEDALFQKRFHVLYFLLGFVWTLILLNEFLPFIKERRLSARQFNLSNVEQMQAMQLDKAKKKLHHLKQMEQSGYLNALNKEIFYVEC